MMGGAGLGCVGAHVRVVCMEEAAGRLLVRSPASWSQHVLIMVPSCRTKRTQEKEITRLNSTYGNILKNANVALIGKGRGVGGCQGCAACTVHHQESTLKGGAHRVGSEGCGCKGGPARDACDNTSRHIAYHVHTHTHTHFSPSRVTYTVVLFPANVFLPRVAHNLPRAQRAAVRSRTPTRWR